MYGGGSGLIFSKYVLYGSLLMNLVSVEDYHYQILQPYLC